MNERRKFIGSSDAAAICGLSPWRTPVDVWLEKTGRKDPDDISGKKAIRRGKMLEPVIREVIAQEAGIEVTAYNQRCAELNGPRVAEIDFEFTLDGSRCNGEIKTANSRKGWGEEWTDQIPDYYMCQVIHAQSVSEVKKTLVVAALGFDDFRYYMVEFDAELAAWIRQREDEFWQCVEEDRAPEPVTLKDSYAVFGVDKGTTIEATQKDAEDVLLWRGLDKQIAGLEDQRNAVEMRLIRAVAENQALTFQGKPIFTLKEQNHSHLDQKGLKAENPELVKKFMVTKRIRVARAAGGDVWAQQQESNS